MADPHSGRIGWYSPDPRGILPMESFHAPRSLRRRVRKGSFRITRDHAFERVIRACARARPDQSESSSWISAELIDAYSRLHGSGHVHSVEAWVSDDENSRHSWLAGGLYGVSLGGVFFGESMFSRATDASKVCLFHLVGHLCQRGYTLLDTQFLSPHLAQFGAVEIPRKEYLCRLDEAIRLPVRWE